MKKHLLTLAFVLCSCLNILSQATSLTVDCQNPGWLSSKIGYLDQQTVTDLTVTGYINATDIEFLGTLMKLYSLKRLDMEQVVVVSSNAEMQNVLPLDMFKIDYPYRCHMEKIALPLSVTKISQPQEANVSGCFSNWLYVDTLVMGGAAMPTIEKNVYRQKGRGTTFGSHVKCLVLREGVESVANDCFYYDYHYTSESINECIFEALVLPPSLKSIGVRAFCGNKFNKLDLPESIETIEMDAFRGASLNPDTLWRPDTLILPSSIKRFNITSFNIPSKVYYFPEGIEYIDNKGLSVDYVNSTQDIINQDMSIEFHIKNTTPPEFNSNVSYRLRASTVYVPQGTYSKYKNARCWKEATIIEENIPVTGISLNYDSYEFDYIGETFNLVATVTPEDATNKKVNWRSSNESVCIVSNGMIVTVGKGTSVVIATTEDGGFMAVCVVTVTSATGVSSIEQDKENSFLIYNVQGARQTHLQKGINIIHFKDGTKKKVLVK